MARVKNGLQLLRIFDSIELFICIMDGFNTGSAETLRHNRRHSHHGSETTILGFRKGAAVTERLL